VEVEEAVVRGTVIATQVVRGFEGRKFVWIEPLDDAGNPTDRLLVAVDTTQCGTGHHVFFVRAREAAEALENPFCPADAAVLGIIDASRRAPDEVGRADR
jgi:microcompartment protein CcmK/EutM